MLLNSLLNCLVICVLHYSGSDTTRLSFRSQARRQCLNAVQIEKAQGKAML